MGISQVKKLKGAFGIMLVICILVFLMLLSRPDTTGLVPLDVTDTSPCTARFGDTMEDDLRKIDSYEFPEAKPYLQKLLPENFMVKDAMYHTEGVVIDQSLPSIPALVTACSANHFSESMELVWNINNMVRPSYKDIKFFYYDMGLTDKQRKELKQICNCDIVTFPFEEFPEHVHIMKGYAWKPLAIQLALKRHRFVIWMDSSIRFENSHLDWAFKHAQSLGVSASVGFAPIASRTQKTTFQFLKESPCLYRETNEFEATFVIVYATDFVMQYFMLPWVSCALTNGCLVPKVSPEKYLDCYRDEFYFSCHRFDQSVLSILMTRLFHRNHDAHVMSHTFFKICKGGYDLSFLPDFMNKIITSFMRSCF